MLLKLKQWLPWGVSSNSAPVTTDGARITFFGGKGGVGKTTCAAAYAIGQASRGEQVLLVSTDPAHSLGDLLELPLGMKDHTVCPGLTALEIDPGQAMKRYLGEVQHNLQQLASPELRDAATRQAQLAMQAPGAEEAALFDEIVRLVLDRGHQFHEIVFDTAPTGHTLQLLTLPEVMGTWADGLLARRLESSDRWPDRGGSSASVEASAEDRAAAILRRRRDRFRAMRDCLRDPGRTRFVPVLNPDTLSREETGRMVTALTRQSLTVDCLIINRVMPPVAVENEGDFWRQRRATEAGHLQAIERDFHQLQQFRLPLSAGEIQGLAALKELSLTLPGLVSRPAQH
ncbi:MAG: ArsA family ATPase [Halomonadaceae bacterium]|nr:MAG: ArsA family ATPase [Halomonadaceae bacterium]